MQEPKVPSEDELFALAREVRERAYSPYSRVQVGAALLAVDGQVFTGCNVENASYGLTLCAERAAVVQAVAAGVREFRAIAIATNLEPALMPCGACRQVMAEFGSGWAVHVEDQKGRRVSQTVQSCLPSAMGPDDIPR